VTEKENKTFSIPIFFWNAKQQAGTTFRYGNFGDLLGPELVTALAGYKTIFAGDEFPHSKLITVGSVLHRAKHNDVVWGAGIKGSKPELNPGVRELDVRAVRGPITYDFLRRRGFNLDKVKLLFDPGLMIAWLYPELLKKNEDNIVDVRFVPHFNDLDFYRRKYPELEKIIINPDGFVFDIAKKIVTAKTIVSSSLHGIIIAEALGIPAIWLAPVSGEDELKFYDYYLGTDRYQIKRATDIKTALRTEPMPLPKFDIEKMKSTFPTDAINSLLITPPNNRA
jgi:hypothetical protein